MGCVHVDQLGAAYALVASRVRRPPDVLSVEPVADVGLLGAGAFGAVAHALHRVRLGELGTDGAEVDEVGARRQGVGSSDAPAVCGVSPWATPLSVFADKVWKVEPERTLTLDMGNVMEDTVAKLYSRANGGIELAKPKMIQDFSIKPHWEYIEHLNMNSLEK